MQFRAASRRNIIGLNDRDKAWHDLYKVNLDRRTDADQEKSERLTGWVFDLKDQLRLATRAAEMGIRKCCAWTIPALPSLFLHVFESCGPIRYHKDGQRVYSLRTRAQEIDLTRLVLSIRPRQRENTCGV